MKKLCIALIRFYRKLLSPLKRKPTCKYYPSCSEYALCAFETHGFFKGSLLSVFRILRCNPWSKGGIDYVPGTPEYLRWHPEIQKVGQKYRKPVSSKRSKNK